MPPPLDNYDPEAVYDLTIVRFDLSKRDPWPITKEIRLKTVNELDQQLAGFASESLLAVLLDEILLEEKEEVHWGSFCLLINEGRAWIHLLAGPCFTARDPAMGDAGEETMKFLIDNGEWDDKKLRDTVSREQGMMALRHWMATTGEKLPALKWGRG